MEAQENTLPLLWEGAATVLAARLEGQTFASGEAVIDAAEAEIASMTDGERASLLASHPPLGAPSERLRADHPISWSEQGRGQVGEATTARLAELNRCYRDRFGFPFVEWVNGRTLDQILPVLEARLRRDRRTELDAGCAALVAIARDRLQRMNGL